MNVQMTSRMGDIMKYAREEAARTGCPCMEPDHIMLGILRHSDNPVCGYIRSLNMSLQDMKEAVESTFQRGRSLDFSEFERIMPTKSTLSLLSASMFEAARYGNGILDVQHCFLALLRSGNNCTAIYLNACGIDYKSVEEAFRNLGILKVMTSGQTESSPVPAERKPGPVPGKSRVFNIVVRNDKLCS